MKISSFKDLIVWQKSMDLVDECYEITKSLPESEKFGLSSQINRCSVSIPSNIAEGYKGNGKKEYIQFCHISLGSSAELETQLLILERNFKVIEVEKALNLTTEVQKMLYALIGKLKN